MNNSLIIVKNQMLKSITNKFIDLSIYIEKNIFKKKRYNDQFEEHSLIIFIYILISYIFANVFKMFY